MELMACSVSDLVGLSRPSLAPNNGCSWAGGWEIEGVTAVLVETLRSPVHDGVL